MRTIDRDISDQLQLTLIGHTSMLVFGGTGVLSMAVAYAVLQEPVGGTILVLLSVLVTVQRVVADRAASQRPEMISQNCRVIVTVGLLWSILTAIADVMCVRTGQPFLLVLASCVSTGLAFGAAFNNAAAPRFARTQLIIMILPYIASVAYLPAPHMLWILSVAPLWISGTFLVVERSYCAKAELLHAEQRVRFLAFNDQLTGLANRAQILTVLHRCCSTTSPSHKLPTYVLFLDLDGFKSINDSFGHDVGDELLCAVAGRLRTSMRTNDFIGRFGGDEFVAILEEAGPELVQEIADRIIARVGEPFNLAGAAGVYVGVTIGGTSLFADDASSVLQKADALLYAAKRAGKGTVRLSPPTLMKASLESLGDVCLNPS